MYSDINHTHKAIAIWLLVVCALIFSMVILGGVTRLTRSGLSMVDWRPVTGVLPPMSQQAWQKSFNHYKQFPEYKKINHGMSLEEYKSIFWFEYSHRLLGRLIGLAFLLPFLFFLVRRMIPRELAPKLVIMFVLGGMQGLLGWYMVKSGLVDKPHVSQYRLTAHLSAALLIYGYMSWVAWGLLFARTAAPHNTPPALRRGALALTATICLMIISGGFVAGTKAGLAYNTFPLMDGGFFPDGLWRLSPWWSNIFENITTIQFNHRLIAWLLMLSIPLFWWLFRNAAEARARLALDMMLGIFIIQITLGITTLLFKVPVALGALHQAGALLLFTAALYLNHTVRSR